VALGQFLLVLRFPLPILFPPTAPHSSSIIRGWYIRPVSGRRTKWTQSHPTPKKLKNYTQNKRPQWKWNRGPQCSSVRRQFIPYIGVVVLTKVKYTLLRVLCQEWSTVAVDHHIYVSRCFAVTNIQVGMYKVEGLAGEHVILTSWQNWIDMSHWGQDGDDVTTFHVLIWERRILYNL
jgi:hypothetical protein